jgi:hypothetical protein
LCTWIDSGDVEGVNFHDYAVIEPGNHGWEFCK